MSLVYSLALLLVCSAFYEPLRNALHSLGEEVGGVGGVGGLTNQWDPRACNSAAGKAEAYCFKEGVLLGLTPFACVFLACWILPFSIAAFWQKPFQQLSRWRLVESESSPPEMKHARKGFCFIWTTLSILWFATPLAAYCSASFYQKDVYHVILAISISAAFPLSWHLALVAVPVPQYLADMIGMRRQDVLDCHKMIAVATLGWAALHAIGQLIYLTSQRSLIQSLNIAANGENLLFAFGVLTAVILLVHFGVAQIRRKLQLFKQIHGLLAAVLLLAAAAHWWPFTFFLIPASGVHATSIALKLAEKSLAAQVSEVQHAVNIHSGKALSCATLAATGAMSVVWRIRQSYMMSNDAGLHLPFLFPPAAILAGFGAALLVSSVVIRLNPRCRQHIELE